MCAIAGAFCFGSEARAADVTIVERLSELQRHRGPDGKGLWSSADGRVAFGHRRLAIIDTGLEGAQPMSEASGRWTVTFNGEIYNYRALRHELEQLGCVFLTNSDTEVLLNAVARWGEAGLRKLRGMYAFALWDGEECELWLARDPYGIKPLYVAKRDEIIWFASQASALARVAPVDSRRDGAALAGFYLWGHVPEPFTWWSGIRAFPPGHVQRVRAGAPSRPARAFAKVEEAYLASTPQPVGGDELHSLLQDSVRHHLVADVPVGLFLSAGVDSSVVAALAAEQNSRLRTMTLAFDEYAGTDMDEAPLAEETARNLGSEHTTVRIGCGEFEALLDDFLIAMDQPSINGLNTYLVSHVAAGLGLKVVLSGLGGDELFGGYPSFRGVPKLARWGQRLSWLQPLGDLAQRTLRAIALPGVPPKTAGLISHSTDLAKAYLLRRALYLEDEVFSLLDQSEAAPGLERLATVSSLAATIAPLRSAGATKHVQIAALESCWYMRNQLLRDTDWSSMAHGVEVRVPFVDFALLERLGSAIASTHPPTKGELVACCTGIPALVGSRAKTGFTTPVRQWISEGGGKYAAHGLRGWASRIDHEFRTRCPAVAGEEPLVGQCT
jgi:asparagine synthase (glutamine-hydrolysing)